jgi:large subunit ribosomal protein L29
LQERIRDEKATLQKLRFTQVVSAVENPMRIRETRREVARTMTELNARLRQTPNA